MNSADERNLGPLAGGVMAVVFALGLVILGVRLYEVQIESSASFSYAGERQSERRVQTAGGRGRILDRNGAVLAGNRRTTAIVCEPAAFQRRTWEATEGEISRAVRELAQVTGLPPALTSRQIRRHLELELARPLVVWRDVGEQELARFCERQRRFPGFSVKDLEDRVYPRGRLAAHLLGFVGWAEAESVAGEGKIDFREREWRGRDGLELYYDEYLRGVAGEKRLIVDARCFTQRVRTVVVPRRGPDLVLTLDMGIQQAVERELAGERGACVVMDPRNGAVLAMASAPDFDLADFVPVLTEETYRRLKDDPSEPLLNRAANGAYAPGSTFKPVTALAALKAGIPDERIYECIGSYVCDGSVLRCSRRWGHGELSMTDALKVSCNPFFCALAVESGTNAVLSAARAFALGEKTGIDLPAERAGVVPDAAWKSRVYQRDWIEGDLVQLSIGQGMLLASPLQMARLTGAIATGRLVRPHLWREAAVEERRLPFSERELAVVREGMFKVVNAADGSGVNGGEGVAVAVCGKTGTAEVGAGEKRYKNAWFVAYAPKERPTVAVALMIEHGVSGGGTAAPKVARILQTVFGRKS